MKSIKVEDDVWRWLTFEKVNRSKPSMSVLLHELCGIPKPSESGKTKRR